MQDITYNRTLMYRDHWCEVVMDGHVEVLPLTKENTINEELGVNYWHGEGMYFYTDRTCRFTYWVEDMARDRPLQDPNYPLISDEDVLLLCLTHGCKVPRRPERA